MTRNLDELLKELPPERRAHIEELTQQMTLESQLYQLRERLHLTQSELAKQMGISQPTVAALEKRGKDLKLMTLKRYVEALGGKINIHVELPDGGLFDFKF